MRKRATVFVVSDFIETGFKKPLSLLNKRHDVVAVPVRDRVEIAMPSVGLIEVQDAETGADHARRHVEPQVPQPVRRAQLAAVQRAQEHASGRATWTSFPIATDKPYMNDLIQFFHMRHRRALMMRQDCGLPENR